MRHIVTNPPYSYPAGHCGQIRRSSLARDAEYGWQGCDAAESRMPRPPHAHRQMAQQPAGSDLRARRADMLAQTATGARPAATSRSIAIAGLSGSRSTAGRPFSGGCVRLTFATLRLPASVKMRICAFAQLRVRRQALASRRDCGGRPRPCLRPRSLWPRALSALMMKCRTDTISRAARVLSSIQA